MEWLPPEIDREPGITSGETGGLPHPGVGWYRLALDIPSYYEGKQVHIEFDGAMSHAQVWLNGEYIGQWSYGYAS